MAINDPARAENGLDLHNRFRKDTLDMNASVGGTQYINNSTHGAPLQAKCSDTAPEHLICNATDAVKTPSKAGT